MATITLQCTESPELRLGPGTEVPLGSHDPLASAPPTNGKGGNVIRFRNGIARFNDAQFPQWATWVAA